MLRASLLFFAAWALGSEAHMVYQQQIPNGARVIRNGVPWFAVGHKKADSDGDGQSNGLELGDPDCVWKVGATPARTEHISHPGFADSTYAAEALHSTTPAPGTTTRTHSALALTSAAAPLRGLAASAAVALGATALAAA